MDKELFALAYGMFQAAEYQHDDAALIGAFYEAMESAYAKGVTDTQKDVGDREFNKGYYRGFADGSAHSNIRAEIAQGPADQGAVEAFTQLLAPPLLTFHVGSAPSPDWIVSAAGDVMPFDGDLHTAYDALEDQQPVYIDSTARSGFVPGYIR